MVVCQDYCGRSEIPVYESNGQVPTDVYIFFRHGARTDFQRTMCFIDGEQTEYTCGIDSGFFTAKGVGPEVSFTKKYMEGCQIGQLLDYALVQMGRLGEYLNHAYEFAEKTDVYLRSTDTERTLGSLDILVTKIGLTQGFVHTTDFSRDSLDLNTPSCPRATYLNEIFAHSDSFQNYIQGEEYTQCAQLWKSEIGTEFNLRESGDCLFASMCANAKLPRSLQPSETLYQCVTNVFNHVRRLRYGNIANDPWTQQGIEYCQLAIVPFLRELKTNSLVATHDDTLACMLSAWKLWDGVWPKYASFITIEKHGEFFRIYRDGIKISDFGSLVDNHDFLNPDNDAYTRACRVNTKQRLIDISPEVLAV